MTKALSFTEASLARRIKGAVKGGLHVVGIAPDGTVITAEKPIDLSSLIPQDRQNAETSKWEDQRG